ncbi:GFA family protein [Paraglaciecola chathamensis]|uniref:CENP-V/GFA domain-containing protein n=1 Tax=Paraglaciecola agarilytica NO2 TaxID=1125747 RepID=A0ABQ0IBM2_9ALTE|nr:GFA family protein [Paraglaciecola agarilytica]GAC06759.1 hypothetical protein GAGA_3926 [Paraglaciecola agarilytica NO2]
MGEKQPMKKITGSCLCGSVQFECNDSIESFHLCHCTQCQKVTGSSHASNLFTAVNNIQWLKGSASIKRYNVPGRNISNAFCGECGSALPYVSLSGKALVIPAGCLDTTPDIMPSSHIFYAERAPWFESAMVCKKYDSMPD